MSHDPHDPQERRAAARIGQVLRGKWRLDKLLGMGGMAAVYAATHRNGSRAAVKLLHPEVTLDPEAQRRFLREGYVANSIEHPGAVRVLDDDMAEDGSVFLVMELLEGECVEDRRERLGGLLPLDETIFVIDGLLDVLDAAHRKGVLHRDIKPHNVFLTHGPSIRLLDFGIARARNGSTTAATSTQSGAMLGTPAFMPPEQALGHTHRLDGRTDLWAAGASMYYLLTGRIVHETDTLNELLVAAASKPAPSLAAVAPRSPAPIVAFVDRALAFHQDARFPDAKAMQRALQETRERLGLPQIPASLEALIAPFRPSFNSIPHKGAVDAPTLGLHQRRPRALVVIGVLGLAATIGGAAALVLISGDTESAPIPSATAVAPTAPTAPTAPSAVVESAPIPSIAPAPSTAPTPITTASAPPLATTTATTPPAPALPAKPSGTGRPKTDWLDRQH